MGCGQPRNGVLAMRFLLPFCILLAGCGTTTDRQTRTVEQEKVVAGPMQVETPFGAFVVQPTQIIRERTQVEVEKERKTIDMPNMAPLLAAAAGGTPWVALISGVLGLGVAAFAGKKAVDKGRTAREVALQREEVTRQRNELIDGIERAKEDLGEQWEVLTAHLEAEQSHDTKKAVKARVG
jgi:hypothetical protein